MSFARRLPVYLVLDCSGSMGGEPIESVRQGLKALLCDLRNDPQAMESAALSVITFASGAQQLCPLTDLSEFIEPNLSASGCTDLGAALRMVEERIGTECRKGTAQQKGDYRPLVFLMTDGQPTDNWETAADSLKSKRLGNIIACAAGPGADVEPLKRITESVVRLNGLEPDALRSFFRWVSASVKTSSVAVVGKPVALPDLPQGLVIVA